jgi:hypothetical protein
MKEERAFGNGRKKVNTGGFYMKEKNILKVLEIIAGRVMALEDKLQMSQYQIEKLKEIIEKAESEAGK